jgi:hypothetical protein
MEQFETDYRLPGLLGTERQRRWARTIRFDFLRQAVGEVMVATQALPPEEQQAVFTTLQRIRQERDARFWIETCRPFLGDPMACVRDLPAAEAVATRRRQEGQMGTKETMNKALESQRLNREATKFERQWDLPPLNGTSTKQTNFGRRCRYQLLVALDGPQFESAKKVVGSRTDAGYWIGLVTTGQGLDLPAGGDETRSSAA